MPATYRFRELTAGAVAKWLYLDTRSDSTGVYDLTAGQVYAGRAHQEPDLALPYIVVSELSADPFNTFRNVGNVITVSIEAVIFTAGTTTLAALMDSIARRMDDTAFLSYDPPEFSIVQVYRIGESGPDTAAEEVRGTLTYRITVQEAN